MVDRTNESGINIIEAPSEKEKTAMEEVLMAFDGVYGYDLTTHKQKLEIGGDDKESRDRLAEIMASLVNLAEVEGQRKVSQNDYRGVPERGMKIELLKNATGTLDGKRSGHESLIGIMPTISEVARDFVMQRHMVDLGMPDTLLGRVFYRLTFPGGDERAKSQVAQIKNVEEYVLRNATTWAEENKAKRV